MSIIQQDHSHDSPPCIETTGDNQNQSPDMDTQSEEDEDTNINTDLGNRYPVDHT
jgi:hypothetical protein